MRFAPMRRSSCASLWRRAMRPKSSPRPSSGPPMRPLRTGDTRLAKPRGRSVSFAASCPRPWSTKACENSTGYPFETARSHRRRRRSVQRNRKLNPMKAFVVDKYKKKSALRLAEAPEPKTQDNDVLIEIQAAGVNLFDSKIRDGEF